MLVTSEKARKQILSEPPESKTVRSSVLCLVTAGCVIQITLPLRIKKKLNKVL